MLRFETNDLDWSYELVAGWERAPEGLRHADVPSVCTDSDDNVYLFCRDLSQVVIYDRDGHFLDAWGSDVFGPATHGTFMSPDDELFLVDEGAGFVGRFTRDGTLLQTIGPRGQRSDSGYDGSDYLSIARGAEPYNRPTGVSTSRDGRIFVSDGYGNSRVHRFSAAGEWELSWGRPGTGPGEFRIPHSIWVDERNTVFVTDRENSRIQLFDEDGGFLSEWRDVYRPQDLSIGLDGLTYVAEGSGAASSGEPGAVPAGRVSIYDANGTVVCRWSSTDPDEADFMLSPHGIWADSTGSVYVAVNATTAGRAAGLLGTNPILKFARV